MANQPTDLDVVLSDAARVTLDQIWAWNADKYGVAHAHEYVEFLLAEIEKLTRLHPLGRPVPGRPVLKYLIVRRRRGGAGHVVVYEVTGSQVLVLQLFHTAQNWPTQIE